MMSFVASEFGFEYVPGTDRLMVQCKSCYVYEFAPRLAVNKKGLFEVVEEGLSIDQLEQVGWRKIGGGWECCECLASPTRI